MVNSDMKSDQKGKGNKGCLWGCLGSLIIGTIFSAILIPQFTDLMPKNETAYAKNTMITILKECINRSNKDLSTNFEDIKFLIDAYHESTNRAFDIQPLEGGNCFNLIAYPPLRERDPSRTWFSINYDPKSGVISKTCGDTSKVGCKKDNNW